MSEGVCPRCGQRMLVRHGVLLPPRSADIFDMVEHSGRRGVTGEVLAWVFYAGKDARAARRLVAVHINRINDFLSSTDVEVRADGRFGPYKVRN